MLCLAIIMYLIFSPTYNINEKKGLSKAEEEELIADWSPEPLVPAGYADSAAVEARPVVTCATGAVAVVDGEEYLNMVSSNFLGLANRPEIKAGAADVICNYGVGSCGPRGFYGTIDVHLQLEQTFANFMGTEDAILYSDGLACVASVIPAFAKVGDLVIADEHANMGIRQGLRLSRSKLAYFAHNDMKSLDAQLAKADKSWSAEHKSKYRRFIVVEGVSAATGKIAPLREIVDLARKYKFRVIVDDSLALGVLGATGRGSYEHWGLRVADVDIICATLDTTVASVGGLCVGSKQVVNHQRLSGSGYCFSAASPPYVAKAATVALGLIDANPALPAVLKGKAELMHRALAAAAAKVGMTISGDNNSPLVHVRIDPAHKQAWGVDGSRAQARAAMKLLAKELKQEHHIIAGVSQHLDSDVAMPEPSLRFLVTALHADADLELVAKALTEAAVSVRNQQSKCQLELAQSA